MGSCRKTRKPLLFVHESTFILKVLRTKLHVQAQEQARVTVRPQKSLSQVLLRQKQDVWVLSSSFSLASMMWKVCVARQLTAGSGSSLRDCRAGTQKQWCLQSDTAGLAEGPAQGLPGRPAVQRGTGQCRGYTTWGVTLPSHSSTTYLPWARGLTGCVSRSCAHNQFFPSSPPGPLPASALLFPREPL